MSFSQPFSEAHSIQTSIQMHKTDGDSGGSSSPVKMGSSEPGTAMSAPVSEMVPRRTKIKVRTSSLTRKYPASA